MVSTHVQHTSLSVCPICHQAASAKRVASLYETAPYHSDARFVPPTAPGERSYLIKPITWGVVIETITLFAVMVICASNHFSVGAYWLALAGICVPLSLSALAFRHMLTAEKQRAVREGAWDEAMATWSQLRYCTVDDVIIDPTVAITRSSFFNEQAHVLTEQGTVPVLAPAA
ncbi:MAG: hypothetical protein NVSMB38_39990 [Ktedonobacteraceae bacterium]